MKYLKVEGAGRLRLRGGAVGNLFSSSDTAKQGRVTLDLNQFVFCFVDTENCLLEMILPSKMCLVMANVSHLKSWSGFLRCTIYIPLVSNLTITVSPIRIGTIR
uniref:Uncharacterized protein n=1 Tax=Quercus lobata TaxID=97700 RepID=A0A7N2MZA1_QUELO